MMKKIAGMFAGFMLLYSAGAALAAPCEEALLTPIKTKQQYSDYYGTTITSSPKMLSASREHFRWGITNPKPLDMAYFAAHVMAKGKKYEYFRAKIYIDSGLKAPMIFSFQKNDRNGETLESVTVQPGATEWVDFPLNGAQKLYIGSEIKINHGGATRLIIGEPEFYNCKK